MALVFVAVAGWLAGWLFNAVAVVVLWWAAAVAAADAVLARTLILVLQPLDPWEAPRPVPRHCAGRPPAP